MNEVRREELSAEKKNKVLLGSPESESSLLISLQ